MATRIAARSSRSFRVPLRRIVIGVPLLIVLARCNRQDLPAGNPPPFPDVSGLESAVVDRIIDRRNAVVNELRSAAAWGRLGAALEVHEFVAEAIICYDRAAELAPDDFRWPYFAGCALLQSDPGRATDLLQRAVRLNPTYLPARIRLADALLSAGQVIDADRHYRESLRLDPNNAHVHLGLSRSALINRDIAACLAHLREAERLDPNDREVHTLLAAVHRQRGEESAAAIAEARAAALPPGGSIHDPVRDELTKEGVGSEWQLRRGGAYAAAADHEKALLEYRQALAVKPDSAIHQFLVGTELAVLGRDDEAIKHLQRAVELRTAYSQARHHLALLFAKIGRAQDAYTQWELVLADEPGNVEALVGLGTFLVRRGRFTNAVGYLERAVQLKPADAETHYQLASAHAGAGNAAAAELEIERTLELAPTHIGALTHRGLIQLRAGNATEAIATFQQAVRFHPTDAAAFNYLGMGYAAARRCTEAATAFRDGLEKQAEDVDLTNNLAWLLATSQRPECRDGETAVRLAQRLCEKTMYQSPRFLDTLAAAYAETGRFDKAMSYAEQAIVIVEQDSAQRGYLNELQSRRELYRARKPLRHD
ncbi:MAG: tetratricopeptide repeat protein [Phycisphaerales bacterium]|nr:tetratricopeptide repeat protein [Phycisphaerales bacterium]